MAAACSEAETGEGSGVVVSSSTVKAIPSISEEPSDQASRRGEITAPSKRIDSSAANKAAKAASSSRTPDSKSVGRSPTPSTSESAMPSKVEAFNGRRIALIHTANMIGEIEPCG